MLKRKTQIAAKVEGVQGTVESLIASDAKLLVSDPSYNAEFDLYDRNIVKSDLSKVQSVTGKKSATTSFGLELRGSGTSTTPPEWSKLLRACGFQQNAVKKLTIGTVSNSPFLHGETITQSTTNATGRIVIETIDGTTTLFFVDTGGGTWNGTNGITGGTSGATATPSAVADAGIEWKPFSDEISQISIGAISSGPYTKGELITGGTSGAKGIVYEETADGASILKYHIVSGSFSSGETVTGGTSGATCTTSSVATQTENPSLTMGVYNDGFLERMKGARGKVKFNLKAGEPAIMDFDFQGVYVDADDAPMLSGVTHESSIPPAFLNAQLTVNDYEAIVSAIEIDCNNSISSRESVNDANGILSYRITGRDLTGSIDPEMVLKSQQDFYAQWKNNTEIVIDFSVGSVSGNKFRFYVPKAQYNNLNKGDREDIRTAELTFSLNGSMLLGDDELTILQF